MQATWGQLDLRAAGALDIDSDGQATGQIVVKATNWREMLEIGLAAGAIPARLADTLENGFEALASASGSRGTLDAPLDIPEWPRPCLPAFFHSAARPCS